MELAATAGAPFGADWSWFEELAAACEGPGWGWAELAAIVDELADGPAGDWELATNCCTPARATSSTMDSRAVSAVELAAWTAGSAAMAVIAAKAAAAAADG